jgi:hypothetical protein
MLLFLIGCMVCLSEDLLHMVHLSRDLRRMGHLPRDLPQKVLPPVQLRRMNPQRGGDV